MNSSTRNTVIILYKYTVFNSFTLLLSERTEVNIVLLYFCI